jgi:hypothetical protein
VAEGEPCIQGPDNFNGGCNSSPEVYSSVNCGDTICGTAWADTLVGIPTRDTDWYLHRFTRDTIVTWTVVAEFPVQINIVNLTAGCGGAFSVAFTFAAACDTARLTADLSAGTYAFFVAPAVFDGFACVDGPHDYAAWLECAPNCAQCPPSGIAEGEGCVEGPDNFNGGCNSTPNVFSPINVGDTICGTSFWNGALRDTDWFQKVFALPTTVVWQVVAEFPTLIGTIDGNSGCPVISFRKFAVADSCDTATVVDTLPAGTFWFFVAPSFPVELYPCIAGPHKYTAVLKPACANIKGDLNGDGIYTSSDVVLILNCVFLGLGSCDLCFADVNCDGVLTSSDVVLELNRVFLGITAAPWCGP